MTAAHFIVGVVLPAPTPAELQRVGGSPALGIAPWYRETVRRLEAQGVDFIVIDDGSVAGTSAAAGIRPDAFALLAFLAAQTQRIGLVAAFDSHLAEPFHVARALASLDHASGGRAGWQLRDESEPTGRAHEFATVLGKLWQSWAPGALLADRASGRFLDAARVQPFNHAGDWFRVRGPLSIARPPQGVPVRLSAQPQPGAIAVQAVPLDGWGHAVGASEGSTRWANAACGSLRLAEIAPADATAEPDAVDRLCAAHAAGVLSGVLLGRATPAAACLRFCREVLPLLRPHAADSAFAFPFTPASTPCPDPSA